MDGRTDGRTDRQTQSVVSLASHTRICGVLLRVCLWCGTVHFIYIHVKYCYNELYIIICVLLDVCIYMFVTFLCIFEAFENSNSTGRTVHLCGGRSGDMLSGHWFPPHVFRTRLLWVVHSSFG